VGKTRSLNYVLDLTKILQLKWGKLPTPNAEQEEILAFQVGDHHPFNAPPMNNVRESKSNGRDLHLLSIGMLHQNLWMSVYSETDTTSGPTMLLFLRVLFLDVDLSDNCMNGLRRLDLSGNRGMSLDRELAVKAR